MNTARPPALQSGYSLVEVVVAMAIAGMTLAGLVQAVGTNLRHSTLTGEYTEATALAESMMVRIGTELPMQPGVRQGRFDETFHWRRSIEVHLDEARRLDVRAAPALTPYAVAVTVWWRSDARIREVTLRSMRLKPDERPAP